MYIGRIDARGGFTSLSRESWMRMRLKLPHKGKTLSCLLYLNYAATEPKKYNYIFIMQKKSIALKHHTVILSKYLVVEHTWAQGGGG